MNPIVEAPEKETYGDVDVVVSGPLDPTFDPAVTHVKTVAENISGVLGAKKWIKATPTMNFAIPWPRDIEEVEDQEKYVQLDIHVCPSDQALQWELFHAAHGDLWNILGSLIRYFGLTVSDRGMFIRIPEIELLDRKKSMIFLTHEPSKIIEFLGMKEQAWWKQFDSRKDMFEYAATCRMFWVKDIKDENEAEGDVIGPVGDFEGQEGGAEGKKKLKHNDRQRMAKRPIFREWVEEFIPKSREEGRYGNVTVTREEIQNDALDKFGVREEFEQRQKEWALSTHLQNLWRETIKETVPLADPQLRGASIRALKKIILEGGEYEKVVPQANKEGFYDLEEVKEFVLANWERAGEIGLERQHEKYMMKLLAKNEEAAAEQNTGIHTAEEQSSLEKDDGVKRRKVEVAIS